MVKHPYTGLLSMVELKLWSSLSKKEHKSTSKTMYVVHVLVFNHPCYYFSHHLTQAENCDGNSPLIVACWKGHGKIVSVLLGNGAQVDDQNKV